ncbi:MAG TPA: hypothetical protein VL983_06770 [Terriglobales bacterium]|nr:hypothetical protein [Terriglobales bacterium]
MLIHKLGIPGLLALMICAGSVLAESQGPKPAPTASPGADYSGMYSFLQDGEFVQLSIEDAGKVSGFVSRYGDTENDRGVFLDHFFKQGKLDGNQLTFTTETVHGVSYEFRGSIERGEGKTPGDEAYYVLKGTLVENSMDSGKKTSSRTREVALKMFPQDLGGKEGKK